MNTVVTISLGDAFEAMAEAEIQEQTRDDALVNVPAIQRAVETLTPHLLPDDRDLWWGELKHCLIARRRAENGDRPWHDTGFVDWDDRVADALERLTGGDQS